MKNQNLLTKVDRNRVVSHLRIAGGSVLFVVAASMALVAIRPSSAVTQSARTYDINTLAGKVASLNGIAGLQIRFSALIEQEAEETFAPGPVNTPITPTYVLTSPLDGTTVLAPAVTVNQDTAAAPQNETAIAVDPNNSNRIVGGANCREHLGLHGWDDTVQRTRRRLLGHILLERWRFELVLQQ
jgi:hypothetical protein